MKKAITGSTIAAPLAAVIAWAWNGWVPDPQMSVEVAASVGALIGGLLNTVIGPVIDYLVSWLPRRKDTDAA